MPLSLRLKSETSSTLTYEWDPVAGATGFRFTRSDQAKRPHTWDASRTTVKFAKPTSGSTVTYTVEALGVQDTGTAVYPPSTPPSPPPDGSGMPSELGWFNVMDYGAAGDGVTDDRAAFQAAHQAALDWRTAHGGRATVFLPDRTYLANPAADFTPVLNVSTDISVISNGARLVNGGARTGAQMIQVNGYRAHIEGLRFDMADQADAMAIRLNANLAYRTLVRNCMFFNNSGLAAIVFGGTTATEDVRIDTCFFFGGGYQILWSDTQLSERTTISGCVFDGQGEAGEAIEINTPTGNAKDVNIVGNLFTDYAWVEAQKLTCIGMAQATGVNIVGNTFADTATRGIHIEDEAADVNIVGNRFVDVAREAIYSVTIAAGNMEGYTVADNSFLRCGGGGFHTIFPQAGGAHPPTREWNITGNRFKDCGSTGAATRAVYLEYASDVRVSDNMIHDQKGNGTGNRCDGVYFTGSGSDGTCHITRNLISGCAAAINLAGSHTNTIVEDNIFQGNTTAVTVSPSGTVRIRRNTGHTTENEGASSVADGGTITHGLAAAPTKVVCTPSVAGETVAVTAKTASAFTVAIKKHDGTAGTTQTVCWQASI